MPHGAAMIQVRQSAGGSTRFSTQAWDSQVGRTAPLRLGGELGSHMATLVAAEVVEDGAAVLLTFELSVEVTLPAIYPGDVAPR